MVDIISATVFGARPGALDNWAMGIQDTLSTAVNDFPTRGIVVPDSTTSAESYDRTNELLQRSFTPTWAWKFVCRIPSEAWRRICNSDNTIAEV